jgi:hypothetical protein
MHSRMKAPGRGLSLFSLTNAFFFGKLCISASRLTIKVPGITNGDLVDARQRGLKSQRPILGMRGKGGSSAGLSRHEPTRLALFADRVRQSKG